MKKLLTTNDFILHCYQEQLNYNPIYQPNRIQDLIFNYANFMNQKIESWMFQSDKKLFSGWRPIENGSSFLIQTNNVKGQVHTIEIQLGNNYIELFIDSFGNYEVETIDELMFWIKQFENEKYNNLLLTEYALSILNIN